VPPFVVAKVSGLQKYKAHKNDLTKEYPYDDSTLACMECTVNGPGMGSHDAAQANDRIGSNAIAFKMIADAPPPPPVADPTTPAPP